MIFVFRFWKSCVPRKGTEGSNPSLCAIRKRETAKSRLPFLLCYEKAPKSGAFLSL